MILTCFANTSVFAKQVVLNCYKPITLQITSDNTDYVIRRRINLQGGGIIVPKGCTLSFERSGRIMNGTLWGNDTKIVSSKNKIFCQLKLNGSFLSDKSRPEWFARTDSWSAMKDCLDYFQGIFFDHKYAIDSTLVIEKPLRLSGKGALLFGEGMKNCVEIRSDSVSISGLIFSCQAKESSIIHVCGSAVHSYTAIAISQCTLTGGKNSIVLDYCNNSSISECKINNVDYVGIGLYSSHFIQVLNNQISNINTSHSNKISYGVTATFHYGDEKSTDIIISGNQVNNNPYWEALGTHGGERIKFVKNIVRNCWRGVSAVGDNHRDTMLCRDVVIESNIITCCNEPLSNGIVFTGVEVGYLSSGFKIMNNKVIYSVIALYSTNNDGVLISGNSLYATDEIWHDVGSRDITFEYNEVELSNGEASHYDKSVFYFKPTETVKNTKFVDINNNIIATNGAPLMTQYKPFIFYKATISVKGNQVSTEIKK